MKYPVVSLFKWIQWKKKSFKTSYMDCMLEFNLILQRKKQLSFKGFHLVAMLLWAESGPQCLKQIETGILGTCFTQWSWVPGIKYIQDAVEQVIY